MNVYTVLVADDSVFMRRVISEMIAADPRFRVIGTAKNGREAVELSRTLKPHVITMDVEMPELNGLEALKIIMKEHPVPVIMLSGLTQSGAAATMRALEAGAFDFVPKPTGPRSLDLDGVREQLYEKLALAAEAGVRGTVNRGGAAARADRPASLPLGIGEKKAVLADAGKFDHLVAIGTSTGGPRALQKVLVPLPADFAAPILVVQHMPPNFTKSLAERLNSLCRIKVMEGSDGAPVERGTAYIAPGGFHMTLARKEGSGWKLKLSEDEPRSGHRPSVDTLFESLLPFKELKRHSVIMTGMGSDGAKGMKALRESGAVSAIAEAEDTCVVYGMPRAAVGLGCVTHQLPLYDIAGKLTEMVKG